MIESAVMAALLEAHPGPLSRAEIAKLMDDPNRGIRLPGSAAA